MQQPPAYLALVLATIVYVAESHATNVPLSQCATTGALFACEYFAAEVITCMVRNLNAESSYGVAAVWIALRLLGHISVLYPIVALAPMLWWSAEDWNTLSNKQQR